MVERLEMQTKNITEENIRKIAELFPNCVTEVKSREREREIVKLAVDFDALRQELSDCIVEGPKERYQFTWPDKSKAKLLANSPTTKTLRPCREESVDFDNTKNLYIEGDNLEVLKVLRETYLGKVKMIYIDPPYNTGNDFVYNDDFSMSSAEYKDVSGEHDEEGNRLVRNVESNGRFHTDWLNMIYPRLKVARDLLTNDGIICVQIDDNEQSNLHTVCNEIFGEHNHLTTVCVKMSHLSGMKMAHKDKKIPKIKEYILIYAKDINEIKINPVYIKGKWEDVFDRYKSYLEQPSDDISTWYKRSLSDKIKELGISGKDVDSFRLKHANLIFRTATNDTMQNYPKDGKFYYVTSPQGLKKIVHNSEEVLFASSKLVDIDGELVPAENIGDIWTDIGINNLHKEGSVNFPNGKKPLKLIKRLLQLFTDSNSIIMDFFSGSATTAHAIYELNYEYGSNKKYVLVQLPELCDEKSDLFKSGYRTICEVGKERIRSASHQYHSFDSKFDTGFRVFKLDESNMKDVFYKPHETRSSSLEDFVSNVKSDRTPEDLLFQAILQRPPLDLSSKVEVMDINGSKVFIVEDGYLVACFDESLKEDVILSIAKLDVKPTYAVFRDSSMTDDAMLSNIEQIFKTYSPVTTVSII